LKTHSFYPTQLCGGLHFSEHLFEAVKRGCSQQMVMYSITR
jgi:hypothetical protein